MNPSIIIPAEQSSQSWIEKNIKQMMQEVSLDARKGRPLPLNITMNPLAYKKFIQILQSKASFFPESDGSFKFLTISVIKNERLPYGTFVVERFKKGGDWRKE